MVAISSKIVVNSSPEKVWANLSDFSSYPRWNPFIRKVEGNVSKGRKVKILLVPAGFRSVHFRPVVVTLRKNKELRFRGKFVCNGFFSLEHYFLIKKVSAKKTEFEQGMVIGGLMSLVFYRFGFLNKFRHGIELMNKALMLRTEGR